MGEEPSEREMTVWRRLVQAYNHGPFDPNTLQLAVNEFLDPAIDRVLLIRGASRTRDNVTAIYALSWLSAEERRAVFPELVYWASWGHGATATVRDVILSLPRDWVLQRIEGAAEPRLRSGTEDEFRRFLELYHDLGSRELTRRLALRAIAHPDSDVRAAGEDFLLTLESTSDQ